MRRALWALGALLLVAAVIGVIFFARPRLDPRHDVHSPRLKDAQSNGHVFGAEAACCNHVAESLYVF